MRIDQLLVRRGLASTRSQAQRLITAGVSWRQGEAWVRVAKNGDIVPEQAEIRLEDAAEARYVSRGGLKLEGALARLGLDVSGSVCLDVGQSTGGFTDCLLQRGAAHVLGIDVGSAQLHAQLRDDPRVTCMEGVNARHLDESFAAQAQSVLAEQEQSAFDLVVGDLSFISQTLVVPALVPWISAGGALLMLVKPQFELQPGQVGRGGIVREPALYPVVEARIREAHAAVGLQVQAYFDSPIAGGDGNQEFFVYSLRV